MNQSEWKKKIDGPNGLLSRMGWFFFFFKSKCLYIPFKELNPILSYNFHYWYSF